jgi:type I restriction enzyme S subunit
MSGWRISSLAEVVEFKNGLNFSEKNDGCGLPIVKVKDFGDRHFVDHESLSEIDPKGLKITEKQLLRKDDIVIVRSNGNKDLVGRSMIYNGPNDAVAFAGFCIRGRVKADQASPQFIHYWLRSPATREKFSREGSGTGIQNVSQALLNSQEIELPDLSEQREIAAVLGVLDDKIEVNRKTAATLEEMARALYRSWFVDFDPVHAKAAGRAPTHIDAATAALFPESFGEDGLPEGWEEHGLSAIATFLNGTALQKYPAKDGEASLPVIKIAELRNGVTPKSGRATKDIPAKFLIENGDVLFSWSGSLLQKVWTNGAGALNQHLFKVSSGLVPKWFHYFAVDQHMNNFRHIAQSKATTMGHIQRHHLDEAMVCVPTHQVMTAAEELISPLFEKFIALDLENHSLAALRDTLLPRLMSGELRVGEAKEQVEAVA